MAGKPIRISGGANRFRAGCPPSGPPVKRSGHVALLLMGTLAVGGGAYGLMPSNNCDRPPNVAQPSRPQNNPNARRAAPPRAASARRRCRAAASTAAILVEHPRPALRIIPARMPCGAAASAFGACRRLFRRRLIHAAHRLPRARRLATTAENAGFGFHTIDGERYWDERAYYAFPLEEIDARSKAPPANSTRCASNWSTARSTMKVSAPSEDPGGVLAADRRKLAAQRRQPLWPVRPRLRRSRPAKLLEYNADTPTSIFEAAVFQWTWLEQAIERQIIPKRADQFNSIHERLIEAWKKLGRAKHLHLAGIMDKAEDAGTLAYLEDTAARPGLTTTLSISRTSASRRRPLRRSRQPPDRARLQALSLGMDVSRRVRREAPERADALDRAALEGDPLQQGHASAAVGDVSGHPNLLPAYFEDDPNAAMLGSSFVRKPLFSREGANVALVSGGATLVDSRAPTAPKVLSARPSRRCRTFPDSIR